MSGPRPIMAALIAVAAAGAIAAGPGSRVPDPVIARVDGRAIALSQTRSRMAGVLSVHGGDSSGATDWRDRVLQSLVTDVIVQREAERTGVGISLRELNRATGWVRDFPPGEFAGWLRGQGMDEEEFLRRMRQQLVTQHVYEWVTADAKPTAEQIAAYYGQHTQEFAGADGAPLSLDEARDRIEQMLTKQNRDEAWRAWLEEQRRAVDLIVLRRDW